MELSDFQKVIDSFKAPEGITPTLAGGRMWNMTLGGNPGLIVSVDTTNGFIYYKEMYKDFAQSVWELIKQQTGTEFTLTEFRH